MKGRAKTMSRRSMCKTAGGGVAWLIGWKSISKAWAQQKLSRQEADYQDAPKDIRMCATCSLFLPPNGCKVVEGEVSPSGWCKLYDLAD
jgi:hypothetical protein